MFLIYKEEGREALKGRFITCRLRGKKEPRLGNIFFPSENINEAVQGEYRLMRARKIRAVLSGNHVGLQNYWLFEKRNLKLFVLESSKPFTF